MNTQFMVALRRSTEWQGGAIRGVDEGCEQRDDRLMKDYWHMLYMYMRRWWGEIRQEGLKRLNLLSSCIEG
jgi:hypothetical protein